jgi:hypothetical protein
VAGVNHTFDGVWMHLGDLAAREAASAGTALAPDSGPVEQISLQWLKRPVTDYDDM